MTDQHEAPAVIPGSTEDDLDRNYTPDYLAEAIVQELDERFDISGMRCLEPHVGAGAFAKALLARPISGLVCVDADPKAPWWETSKLILPDRNDIYYGDTITRFEEYAKHETKRFDLAPGNPPFSDAERQIRSLFSVMSPRGIIVQILPLHWHGSTERRAFFDEFRPTEVDTVRPRIGQFVNGKPEMREMALYIWELEKMGKGRKFSDLGHFDYVKPRKARVSKAKKETATHGTEEDRDQGTEGKEEHETEGVTREEAGTIDSTGADREGLHDGETEGREETEPGEGHQGDPSPGCAVDP